MAYRAGCRSLWLTVPLYLVLGGVAGVNAWAAVFWMQVGGSLGGVIAGGAIAVALIIAVLVSLDLRRQWSLAADAREDE
jgi:hypothetical protein